MSLSAVPASAASVPDHVEHLVVVAPHPDDEVLGCGLLLAEAAARGLDVRVIAVTDGEAAYADADPGELAAVRRREQDAAIRALGLRDAVTHRLGLPDGHVDRHVDVVADAIRSFASPASMLVAPSVHDWHPDHVACGAAAAAVAAATSWDGPRWSSVFWAHHHPAALLASRPRLLRLLGRPRHVAARAAAIGQHHSQLRHHGGAPILPADLLAHLARPCELYVDEGDR